MQVEAMAELDMPATERQTLITSAKAA